MVFLAGLIVVITATGVYVSYKRVAMSAQLQEVRDSGKQVDLLITQAIDMK